jgi:hypothetical protein
MPIGRHSFIRNSKLPDVKGRVDYISNPERQEHLYATYQTSGVSKEFWSNLARENQQDFKASGTKGKCIEGRELIIALPECFTEYQPEDVVKLFTETFHSRYDVECCAALHHNKTKTNYHIHLIFSERKLLEQPQVKIATRNMFYNEQGKHVRTKKEILDDEGNIRKGCQIIPKGEVYESHIFSSKEEYFKSKAFTREVKEMYTKLINQYVKVDSQKLSVFQPGGVYLPTKKIGKNNPKAAEIKADNEARQEWNRTVDVALVEGVPEEKILEIKKEKISERVNVSVIVNGEDPRLFRNLLLAAIRILLESIEKLRIPPKPKLGIDIKEFRQMEELKGQLDKKTAAIRRAEQVELPQLEKELADIHGLFKGKAKKEAQMKIDKCKKRIARMKDELKQLVKRSGYPSVQKFMEGYNTAYKLVEEYKKELADWKQKTGQTEPEPEKKKSIIARLRENDKRIKEQDKQRTIAPKKHRDMER